ncbi:NUDIX domain-containing protein [Nonomuraea sp. MG754425]|uniref:NUDIX hydrolase n=1 Tax=Nonomuraea sp. MG754425 TaxID=2570319 RepID=UPI001F2B05E3|nr:NUDIX domain-containing protein [Nonomuraea sp. MG754425]MCF6475436.1 NUDIX domain-containing protein [Nonomuraea sp. MG754425]
MTSNRMRRGARAIILDQDDRVLLCRIDLTRDGGPVVWAAPGGGVEPGETDLQALARELEEEVGLSLGGDPPPHVWHQSVADPQYAPGYDGVVNEYFLLRRPGFAPRGTLSDEQIAAENISGWRWWSVAEIAEGNGDDQFSPRDLAGVLGALLAGGVPREPVRMGL